MRHPVQLRSPCLFSVAEYTCLNNKTTRVRYFLLNNPFGLDDLTRDRSCEVSNRCWTRIARRTHTHTHTHRVQLLHEIDILSDVLNQLHSANVLHLQHQVPLISTGMLDVSLLVAFVLCSTRVFEHSLRYGVRNILLAVYEQLHK